MLQRCVEEAGIASLNAEANQAATSLKSDSMVVDAMAPLQPEDLMMRPPGSKSAIVSVLKSFEIRYD